MRKAIDIILTINLVVLTAVTVYLWTSGRLSVVFSQPQTAPLNQSLDTLGYLFGETLKEKVQTVQGEPIGGYKPDMLLAVFPGLVRTDFENVETSIGMYVIETGTLVHSVPADTFIHSTPDAISRRGFETLLKNVSLRTGIDIKNEGTITQIMAAISQ